MDKDISYIFDCPVHGAETNALCWRAFLDENLGLWRKYEVLRKELEFTPEERKRLLNDLCTYVVPADRGG